MSRPQGDDDQSRRVPDRYVLFVAAVVVAAVLGMLALSIYVPAVGEALALAPVLIAVLVVVTGVVLLRSIRARGP
jgi:hypothetical protein